MAISSNIERFNCTTLLLLERLYVAFPVPVEIDVAKLALDTIPTLEDFDDSFASIKPTYHAIEFLAAEGFITHKGATLDARQFGAARLTSKALAILGATPSSLEHHVKLIDSIRGVLKAGAKEASGEMTKKLVEMIFTYAPAIATVATAVVKS